MSSSDSDEEQQLKGKTCKLSEVTGLPATSKAENAKEAGTMKKMLPLFMLMPRLIGFGVVAAIYWGGNSELYDKRMKSLMTMHVHAPDAEGKAGVPEEVDMQIQYLYLAIGLFSFLTTVLNNLPMLWKARFMPGNAGNLRSNMMISKVNFQPGANQELPYVVMEEEDDIGGYNRANRALMHFVENVPGLALCIVAAGLVFPLPVLILVSCYFVCRVWYQIAYATGGYGLGCCKHALPFMFHSILIAPSIEMLVWFTGVRMILLGQQ